MNQGVSGTARFRSFVGAAILFAALVLPMQAAQAAQPTRRWDFQVESPGTYKAIHGEVSSVAIFSTSIGTISIWFTGTEALGWREPPRITSNSI